MRHLSTQPAPHIIIPNLLRLISPNLRNNRHGDKLPSSRRIIRGGSRRPHPGRRITRGLSSNSRRAARGGSLRLHPGRRTTRGLSNSSRRAIPGDSPRNPLPLSSRQLHVPRVARICKTARATVRHAVRPCLRPHRALPVYLPARTLTVSDPLILTDDIVQ